MEQKTCKSCKKVFPIFPEDQKLLEKLNVSPPTFCPDCRLQRRLAWRVERTLYFRTCDLTGKQMMSIFPPKSPYKVYSHEAWYSDKWNALDYGRPFDFARPFFKQFAELMKNVPLMGLNVIGLQNCDFVNQCGWSKNCYLTIEADHNEDCMYSYRIFYSKNCVDCTEIHQCQLCYESVDCETCYNLKFSQLCRQCSDSAFLYDCIGCSNCFGCTGLRHARYCMFNEQLTKQEYEERMKKFDFCDEVAIAEARKRFEELKLAYPRKAIIGEMNDNVTGNYIYESKDCFECYSIRKCRDCRYCQLVREVKDSMDVFVFGWNLELTYESECCGYNSQNLRFCVDCWEGAYNLTYCLQCVIGTNNCFGCIGLQKGKYCILNKQYSEEEYKSLVPRIIEHMKKTGEWGEFFPIEISPYTYNETVAQEYFPLTKEEVVAKGWNWKDELPFTKGKETISWNKIPKKISEVTDSILNEILTCQETGKNYRLTAQELRFYRRMNLPIPKFHPDERHKQRLLLRNPQKLWDRNCGKCGTLIKTSYDPARPEKVYCEKCYLEAVY